MAWFSLVCFWVFCLFDFLVCVCVCFCVCFCCSVEIMRTFLGGNEFGFNFLSTNPNRDRSNS